MVMQIFPRNISWWVGPIRRLGWVTDQGGLSTVLIVNNLSLSSPSYARPRAEGHSEWPRSDLATTNTLCSRLTLISYHGKVWHQAKTQRRKNSLRQVFCGDSDHYLYDPRWEADGGSLIFQTHISPLRVSGIVKHPAQACSLVYARYIDMKTVFG